MKRQLLSELNAEIRSLKLEGERVKALWFDCPVCEPEARTERAHWQVVPYGPESTTKGGMHVWKHVSGSTVDDLTLAPSYVSESSTCRIHVFVRGGHLDILGDTRRKP